MLVFNPTSEGTRGWTLPAETFLQDGNFIHRSLFSAFQPCRKQSQGSFHFLALYGVGLIPKPLLM